jgi:hypothetical protein
MKWARRMAQVALTRFGSLLQASHVRALNSALNYLETGRWFRSQGFGAFPRYRRRSELHSAIASRFAEERVLYLEFGVYQGESLRLWSKLLRNPGSTLHGFDSFEGLPEAWDTSRPKGTFDVRGKVPNFADKRVQIHPGWFTDTLPSFALPVHDRLIVHLDADLYSSTAFVLEQLENRILPGAVLIFDEFCDRLHEQRAFEEHLHKTGHRFRVLGATNNLEQVSFERVG